MAVPLPHYSRTRDAYCLVYLGRCTEYISQLLILRPLIEQQVQPVKLFIACNDDIFAKFSNHERLIPRSQLIGNERMFGYVRELRCNLTDHPVELFLTESGIDPNLGVVEEQTDGGLCVILPHGNSPTKSLTDQEIRNISINVDKLGYAVKVGGDPQTADWVVGVECDDLFWVAAKGKHCTLVDTGIGAGLFKKMFPWADVIRN